MFERLRLIARLAPLIPKMVTYRPTSRVTITDQLEARAAEHPDRPFLLFEQRRILYGELNARANRVAHWGLSNSLGHGDVVALLMENRPEYLYTWMGLAKLGVTIALLNTNLSGRGLRHALAVSGARHLVLGAECAGAFATTANDLESPLDVWAERAQPGEAELPDGAKDLNAALPGQTEDNPDPSVRDELRASDDLFYIYTSGTTGLPKAARLSHLRFLAGAVAAGPMFDIGPGDVHYCALPLYHAAGGVGVVSAVLGSGATMGLRRKFSASGFWDDVRLMNATHFQYIGEFCRYLLNQPPREDDRDHRVRLAIGNGLRPDIWETFQSRFGIPQILEFYGATEGNTGFMNFENKVGSVGRMPFSFLSNARLIRYDVETDTHPRDERGFCIECDTDEPGELIGRIPTSGSRGVGRFEGYTSKEATERKILRDVFRRGDAWFLSGDLLRQDDEGFFYFVDRIGDTFRWKGENVSTQDVAESLSGFPGLELANVYGVEVEGADGRAGMAAIALSPETHFDGKLFYAFVAERLPAYAAPAFVRIVEGLETTGTLKLPKVALQKEGYDIERIRDAVLVREDAQGAYVPLTRDVLSEIRAGRCRL